VLLGTPHRGTGDFTSQALVLRIINAEIPVELSIVDVLKPKNETLIDLFDEFTNLIADDKFVFICESFASLSKSLLRPRTFLAKYRVARNLTRVL
jgi:hypothetical protein